MTEKAEQGIYPSFASLGYINTVHNGKRYIQPDPNNAHLVRQLFEWYATGDYSLLEVTKKAREEGLTYRITGKKIQKSSVHKMLTNPIYYGEFDWKNKRYKGIHEPIITKELFDRIHEVLRIKGQRRTRQQKHQWAFQGLISCAHCGCTMTAEIKKGKYIYYHCTGYKGKCPEKYVREEEIDKQFAEALKTIKIDGDVLEWMIKALSSKHS